MGRIPETQRIPVGLEPSKPPLTLVCGAPGSGKTTYVDEHRSETDIVIDLDDIIDEMTGRRGVRTADRSRRLQAAIRTRNARLDDLAYSDASGAWLIVCAPNGDERREWAQMLGAAETIVLLTPIEETVRRIRADVARTPIVEQLVDAAHGWWRDFTPWQRDTVVV